MKILSLSASNVKVLKSVFIKPDGNLIQISGNNGSGKTTTLDCIEMAVVGGRKLPEKPIRTGQKKAAIEIDLGDLVVRRTFTEAGTALTVKNKDGAKYDSPQAILDKLVGAISFDPLEFVRQGERDTAKQSETLRKLVGLDFSALDAERARLYEERKMVNRELKSLESRLAAAPRHPDAPDREESSADILKQQQNAQETNNRNATLRNTANAAKIHHQGYCNTVKTLEDEIRDIEAKLKQLQGKLTEASSSLFKAAEAAAKAEEACSGIQDVDMAPFRNRLAKIEDSNRKARENRQHADLSKQVEDKKSAAEKLDSGVKRVDLDKSNLIAKAKFPVEGLSVDEDGNILFRGLPFSQASTAEQLRVSVAIGIALNPALKVMLVRNGNDLDQTSLEMVAKMAEENDIQLWMEVIKGGPGAVLIEGGEVKDLMQPGSAHPGRKNDGEYTGTSEPSNAPVLDYTTIPVGKDLDDLDL